MGFLYTLTTLACAIGHAAAIVNNYNAFQYPGYSGGGDTTWVVGETRQLRWYTEDTSYTVHLWASDPPTEEGILFQSSTLDGQNSGNVTFDWVVSPLNYNLTESTKFFLWGVPPGQGTDNSFGWTSYSFYITKASPSKPVSSGVTGAVSTTASSMSASPSPTQTTPPTSSASDTTTNSHTDDKKSSNSTVIGVGVGVGAAAVILIALAVFFGLKYRNKRKQRPGMPPTVPILYDMYKQDDAGTVSKDRTPYFNNDVKPTEVYQIQQHEVPSPPAELPGYDNRPRELGA